MNDDQVLDALKGVCDPELGIGIVDLGLVFRFTQRPHRIDVALMPTSPSCPLGEFLVEALQNRHFSMSANVRRRLNHELSRRKQGFESLGSARVTRSL
jgi:metal-sulfur cluster biosynthetic enzyme